MLVCYLYQTIKDTKYRKEWAKIYDLKQVDKIFNMSLELTSFKGVKGILWDCEDVKDSILV